MRRGRDASTYIVVLDGEQNEPVGVLLKEGLMGLLFLDGGCSGGLLGRVLLDEIGDANNGPEDVLLVDGRLKVELLCRRVGHLECVEC